MKHKKKIIAVFLAFCMLISLPMMNTGANTSDFTRGDGGFSIDEAVEILKFIVDLQSDLRVAPGGAIIPRFVWEYEMLDPFNPGIGINNAVELLKNIVGLPNTAIRRTCGIFPQNEFGRSCGARPNMRDVYVRRDNENIWDMHCCPRPTTTTTTPASCPHEVKCTSNPFRPNEIGCGACLECHWCHCGGAGFASYIVHFTEQEALGIILALLEAEGLSFDEDFFDSERNIAVASVKNDRFTHEITSDDDVIRAVFNSPRSIGVWGHDVSLSHATRQFERDLAAQVRGFIAYLHEIGILPVSDEPPETTTAPESDDGQEGGHFA
jgi:hypothetical protein